MKDNQQRILKSNSKVDQKVVKSANALHEKIPDSFKPKSGSDYKISPALGGKSWFLYKKS